MALPRNRLSRAIAGRQHARDAMTRTEIDDRRRLSALGLGERAARMESAAGRRRRVVGHITLDGSRQTGPGKLGHRIEKRPGIGMYRVAKQGRDIRLLDDRAGEIT